MKKLLFVLVVFLCYSNLITAQKKTVDISKVKIGFLKPSYLKTIDIEAKDTTYYVYIGFQNQKYTTITDTKSVFLTKDIEVKVFIDNLKMAMVEMETKQNIKWEKELYTLGLFDFSNRLYVFEKPTKGNGYTTISKKEVEELIKWLESFEFGKG